MIMEFRECVRRWQPAERFGGKPGYQDGRPEVSGWSWRERERDGPVSDLDRVTLAAGRHVDRRHRAVAAVVGADEVNGLAVRRDRDRTAVAARYLGARDAGRQIDGRHPGGAVVVGDVGGLAVRRDRDRVRALADLDRSAREAG